MLSKIHIINTIYLTLDGSKLSVGGVETYISNLCRVIIECGYEPIVYQMASKPFDILYDGVKVHGIVCSKKKIVKEALKIIPENEVVVFANDEVIHGRYKGKTLAIQHGIGWDLPIHKDRGALADLLYFTERVISAYKKVKNNQRTDVVVCVDYNYLNWYRTQVNASKAHFEVIPNFTRIPYTKYSKSDNTINIIFARRFVNRRGTRIFVPAIKRIINEYRNVDITFAGNGPDEEYIKEQFANCNNVHMTQYGCEESLKVHSDKHIAVIPSIGSEGTSLSLLEAMASGCAVICTNVGGMTNIVLDHYNGLMVSPDETSIYLALKELLDNRELLKHISDKGYETAKYAFSYEKWSRAWERIIHSLENEK